MKKTIQLFCALCVASLLSTAHAACPSEPGCTTDWLNVPGDFSNPVNHFSMYLLGGLLNVYGIDGVLDTTGNRIDFTATPFDHVGAGQGTSILDATFNHAQVGSTMFFGWPASVFIDGDATGTLVDHGDGTGTWTLNTHVFGTWNGELFDFGIVPLSTNASYSYFVHDLSTGIMSPATAAGVDMNYHSGLAFFVGQGAFQGGAFNGIPFTIGLQGQDPLVAPVPVPAAGWLLSSGLLGLAGCAKKRRTVS